MSPVEEEERISRQLPQHQPQAGLGGPQRAGDGVGQGAHGSDGSFVTRNTGLENQGRTVVICKVIMEL